MPVEVTTELWCRNCGQVYDVDSLGPEEYRVHNPHFELIVDHTGEVRPPDMSRANQLQSAVKPLCMVQDCLFSRTRGYLTDEPIPVDLWN